MNSSDTAWSRTTKYIVGVGLVLFGIYILYLSRNIIPLLIIAALIAVLTRPIIRWLHLRLHLARGVAVAIVYLGAVILFPLAILLGVSVVVDAVQYVLNLDYARLLRGGLEWLRSVLGSIRSARLPVGTLDAYIDQIVNELLESLQGTAPSSAPEPPSVATILRYLGSAFTTTFTTVTSLVGAVVSNVVLFIFVILASIYMNLGVHTYQQAFMRAVPDAYQPEISILMARIGRMWNAFFHGELSLMIIIGLMSWLGLTVLGIPGAVYLGIIAGLLELIPNLGPVIATIPAVIVALLQGSTHLPLSNLAVAALVIGFYVLVQQLENNLIVPRVLGDAVDLPPLVVLTGVLVGTSVAGLLGALLATPVIASVREILRYINGKMQGVDPFPPEEAVLAPPSYSIEEARQRLLDWAHRLARFRFRARHPQSMDDAAQPPSGDAEEEALPHQK